MIKRMTAAGILALAMGSASVSAASALWSFVASDCALALMSCSTSLFWLASTSSM